MLAATMLRVARRRAGLSLRALAELAGTSHATLAAYESGAKVPRVDTLARILGVVGFGLDLRPAARIESGDPDARGRELAQTLELAERFPARHEPGLAFPRFGRSA